MGPNSVGSSQIKRNAVGTSEIKRNGVGGSEVRNRSLTAQEFARGVQLQGAQGIQGARGLKGEQGPQGPFPDGDLPSGKTLRGAFAPKGVATADSENITEGESFGFRLAANATDHIIRVGDASTSECPGTANLPEALPGHLCVYAFAESNLHATEGIVIDNPAGSNGQRYGFVVQIRSDCPTAAACVFGVRGTWAVTSP